MRNLVFYFLFGISFLSPVFATSQSNCDVMKSCPGELFYSAYLAEYGVLGCHPESPVDNSALLKATYPECSPSPPLCTDGTPAPGGDTLNCDGLNKTCPDGTVIPSADICPTPCLHGTLPDGTCAVLPPPMDCVGTTDEAGNCIPANGGADSGGTGCMQPLNGAGLCDDSCPSGTTMGYVSDGSTICVPYGDAAKSSAAASKAAADSKASADAAASKAASDATASKAAAAAASADPSNSTLKAAADAAASKAADSKAASDAANSKANTDALNANTDSNKSNTQAVGDGTKAMKGLSDSLKKLTDNTKQGLPSSSPKPGPAPAEAGKKFYTSDPYVPVVGDGKHSKVFGTEVSNGKLYSSDGTRTFDDSVTRASGLIKQTPLATYIKDVFDYSFPSAGCPVWHIPGVMSMPDISIAPLCSDFMGLVWTLVSSVLKILAVFIAFKIAFSPL